MILDAKGLKQLAKACRDAGITHYRCADFEFTLSPEAPVSNYKKKAKRAVEQSYGPVIDDDIASDRLSDEALLMWSSLDPSAEPGAQ